MHPTEKASLTRFPFTFILLLSLSFMVLSHLHRRTGLFYQTKLLRCDVFKHEPSLKGKVFIPIQKSDLITLFGNFMAVIYKNKQTKLTAEVLHFICVTVKSSIDPDFCSSGTFLIYTVYVYSH